MSLQRSFVRPTLHRTRYTSWPDHGVPLTTHEMLGFRNAINASITDASKPQLIHCSAGVGRTGTYIAIDRIMKQCLDMGGNVDVDDICADMRMARNFMVQTEVQYMFIFRAVLDAVSDLLNGESSKAQSIRATEEIRFAAEQAKREEAERNALEQALIGSREKNCWPRKRALLRRPSRLCRTASRTVSECSSRLRRGGFRRT